MKIFTKQLTKGEKIALTVAGAGVVLFVVGKTASTIAEHYRTRPPALVDECTEHSTTVLPVTRIDGNGKAYVTTETRTTCVATRKVCRAPGSEYSGAVTCDQLWATYNAKGNPDE